MIHQKFKDMGWVISISPRRGNKLYFYKDYQCEKNSYWSAYPKFATIFSSINAAKIEAKEQAEKRDIPFYQKKYKIIKVGTIYDLYIFDTPNKKLPKKKKKLQKKFNRFELMEIDK